MAISLSDLTGASTSGNVLNEVNSYADFLDSVPRLVNKADPTGATDAVQTVATKQPTALPLIDGEGYLYCTQISGNYGFIPAANASDLYVSDDFTFEIDVALADWSSSSQQHLFSSYYSGSGDGYEFYVQNGFIRFLAAYAGASPVVRASSIVNFSPKQRVTLRLTRTGTTLSFEANEGSGFYSIGTSTTPVGSMDPSNYNFYISGWYPTVGQIHGAIFDIKIWEDSTQTSKVLDIDFTSPRIPHGATEFTCETGQVVTVNTSGNNPAKVIKKPVLRFPAADDGSTEITLKGLLNQTVTDGYFFAAFSVLGNGVGGYNNGRIFGLNSTGANDNDTGGWFVAQSGTSTDIISRYNGDSSGNIVIHEDVFDDVVGDILLEHHLQNGSQISKVNNANEANGTTTSTGDLSSEEFSIASYSGSNFTTAIDLEYLALFPATLSDSQADQIRNFINNRNKVFYRWDTDGYYFFDGAATTDGQVFTTGGTPWNGRIVGSDNGDADFKATEDTNQENRPTTDGYKVTFADNSDKLDIPQVTLAAGDSYAWMVCGTSLGTFAYKVTVTGEIELRLLGHTGHANANRAGDLYGVILLPQDATSRQIEEARMLLINRGASDGVSVTDMSSFFRQRDDIVEFKPVNMDDVTSVSNAWRGTALTSFGVQLPEATRVDYAWYDNTSLSSFTTTDIKKCSYFLGAWQDCPSLTQFPQDAKLGTEATNVIFSSAWQNSGLRSFPALDLSTGSNFSNAWRSCSSLQSFPEDAKLGTEASNVNIEYAWKSSGLTSFSTPLPTVTTARFAWQNSALKSFSTSLPLVSDFNQTWSDCGNLKDFNVESLPLATFCSRSFLNTGLTSFSTNLPKARLLQLAWKDCSDMTDFSTDVFANWNPTGISDSIFNLAWDGCTSLTAQSVENILVPIANSGKWATNNGTSGGNPITDATIDIDYKAVDPNNPAITYPLTAATLSAIETLNGRGWSVNINNEIIVPNILQLQPAAAYSLRSFDSDADPTVVNVRRSSDGSLSDFTASQVSDGTLEAWVGSGNDGYVTTWYDQSGNGNNSTQSTASSQPLIVQNGVLVTEGGEAALDINKTPLDLASTISFADLTWFTVTKKADSLNAHSIIFDGNSSSVYGGDDVDTKGNPTLMYNIITASIGNTSASGGEVNQHLSYYNRNGSNASGGLNGEVNTEAAVSTTAFPLIRLFKYSSSNDIYDYVGKAQEIVLFDTDQSVQRTGIEKNINDHFGIY